VKGAVVVMDENNLNKDDSLEESRKTASIEPASDKKNKKSDKNKSTGKGSDFFAKHRAEFKKIKWPNRQELFKETVVVIIISLAVGAVIFGMDTVFQFVFGKIVNLL